MAKRTTRAEYVRRMTKVALYIDANLDGDLSLDRLADVACFSRFHFQRIYAALAGETVAETVQRLRLYRASGELARTDRPIEVVARRAGFGSKAAFTRAFRRRFGATPGALRAGSAFRQEHHDMTELDIRTIAPIRCAAVPHRGPYTEIGPKYGQLAAWAAVAGLSWERPRVLAIPYDDPKTVPAAELRAHACLAVDDTVAVTPPAEEVVIAGGRYAVFRHVGPYADLHRTYRRIFGEALPAAGLEPADRPAFEDYLNAPAVTAPAELVTDIYVPLP